MNQQPVPTIAKLGYTEGASKEVERRNSKSKRISRTRQTCGFFAPELSFFGQPGGRRIQHPQGEEVRLACSRFLTSRLPSRMRVETLRQGLEDSARSASMPQSVRAIEPILAVVDGTPTTTSNEVARHFGKRHDNVMQAIAALRDQVGPDHALNFQEMVNEVQVGSGAVRKDPAYRLTRDGFTLLAMGFTGKKALTFKLAYIDAFNRMEAQLRGQATSAPYSVAPRQSLTAEEADTLRNLITGHAATLPKDKQADFTIKAWSKLKSHFGCTYRDIPREKFIDAMSLIGRHLVAYSTPALETNHEPAAQFSRSCQLPTAQIDAITSRLQRVSSVFHPFSDQFADCMGLFRALRGNDPQLGHRRQDFIAIVQHTTH